MKDQKMIERSVCACICAHSGIKAREIARQLNLDTKTVNRVLYLSPFMRDLCYRDEDYRWHGIIHQGYPHRGLRDHCGYYSLVGEFISLSEEEWMDALMEGCTDIGRNLNDTRGLFHSFRDSRQTMLSLFEDLSGMTDEDISSWEIAFELRIHRARYIRIFADVLVITKDKVFSLEFKMKDVTQAEEIEQAAKYTSYLEIIFGPSYDVIPVLVLTRASDLFSFETIGESDMLLPVCSGDMLFNVFDEFLGFLGP